MSKVNMSKVMISSSSAGLPPGLDTLGPFSILAEDKIGRRYLLEMPKDIGHQADTKEFDDRFAWWFLKEHCQSF